VSSAAVPDAAALSPVTCPFCGLACDDLRSDGAGSVDTRGCPLAAAGYARDTAAAASARHAVAGAPASLDEAAAAAARLLVAARQPLIAGLSADLAGIRAALALADRTGAIIDHARSAAVLTNLAEVQSSGWMTTTFAEVANRADLILIVGRDPTPSFPRFFERLVQNPKPLYRAGPPDVVFLGDAGSAPDAVPASSRLAVRPGELAEAIGALGLLVAGRTLRRDEAGGVPAAALRNLADRFLAARYSVVVWDAASLANEGGGLVVDAVTRVVRRLNETTRCAGLPLGGSGNALGAVQAMLWQSGWPVRISFADGVPVHDPWAYDAMRLLSAGEADTLLWVATIDPQPPPEAAAGIPTIAVIAGDVTLAAPPAVEIRVGCPGIDHAGTVVRSDTVISLPLVAARPSAAPSVAQAMQAILSHLPAAASPAAAGGAR